MEIRIVMILYEYNDKKFYIPDNLKVVQLPIISVNKSVTNILGVVLDSPVIIPAKSQTSFFVEIPLDIGVFATDGKNYRLLFTVERFPKKYSLYGSIKSGFVYRYWTSRVYDRITSTENDRALTKVEIVNDSESIGDIKSIIFNTSFYSLFSKDGAVYGELIKMERIKKGLALVKHTNKPSVEGAKLYDHTPLTAFTRQLELSEGT